jgi:hypothetical protein
VVLSEETLDLAMVLLDQLRDIRHFSPPMRRVAIRYPRPPVLNPVRAMFQQLA